MSMLSENVFEMISNPVGINISLDANPRLFRKVIFKDSLLHFFPYGEVHLRDKQGIIASGYPFIEGMEFDTKFGRPAFIDEEGNELGGYLTHTYAWSEDQILNTIRDSEYISGDNCFILISNFYCRDHVIPTAYRLQPSDIATLIAQQTFGIIDPTKLFIDTTTNDPTNIWYQGNRKCRDFLEYTLTRNAVASSIVQSEKVPFVSFINCAGEFYFCSYATLYKQTPIATFYTKVSTDKLQDPFAIQEIIFQTGGIPINSNLYQQDSYSLDELNNVTTDTLLLSDKVLKIVDTLDKCPVNINHANQLQSISNMGLVETGDEFLLKAHQSFQFQNSCLAYRITIVIIFNPKMVAGKVIEIKIKDFLNNGEYLTSLSGNWLIIESEHFMDKDPVIYSKLTLAKPSLSFSSEWLYTANII
jgi:hypothetical protein